MTRIERHMKEGTYIEAVAFLSSWQVPEQVVHDLKIWARQPNEWLGGKSLECLAHQRFLQDDDNLLGEVLGLRKTDQGYWDTSPDSYLFDWIPQVIGLLYAKRSEQFEPAIASLVREADWLSASAVFEWIRYCHGRPDSPPTPESIIQAILNRAHTKQTATYGEPDVFMLLADVAPENLASEKWTDECDSWLPLPIPA